jgi:hypothetical protein
LKVTYDVAQRSAPREEDSVKARSGILLLSVGVSAIIWLAWPLSLSGSDLLRFWLAGGGALGLLTGYTTGLSKETGSGIEFVKFLSAGLVVPIIGALAALLSTTETVTISEYSGSGAQPLKKITETVASLSDASLHPAAALGSFFAVFGLFAVLGLTAGALFREGNVITLPLRKR